MPHTGPTGGRAVVEPSNATRQANLITEEARKLVGVRWAHLGRDPGSGLDCLGVVVAVAKAVRLVPIDFETGPYGHYPSGTELVRRIRAHCQPAPGNAPAPGTIGVFRVHGALTHVGLFVAHPHHTGRVNIIHAYAPARQVVEHGLTPLWRERLNFVFLPGSD